MGETVRCLQCGYETERFDPEATLQCPKCPDFAPVFADALDHVPEGPPVLVAEGEVPPLTVQTRGEAAAEIEREEWERDNG